MSNTTRRKNKKKTKKGGSVINSGGFGCVFRPTIRCKNSNKRTSGISKLLLKENSNDEWKQLTNIYKIIVKIPNYHRYFLLKNISRCTPNKLVNTDLINIDKCDQILKLVNNDINLLNKNLEKFEIINMPYGGEDLESIIRNNKLPFKQLNGILIDLFINGINKMNRFNFFHSDLKAQNILFLKNNARIIDFGVSFYSNSKFKNLPDILLNRNIQFNSPICRIIFSDFFDKNLKEYVKNNRELNFYKFSFEFYEKFMNSFDKNAHHNFLNNIVKDINANLKEDEDFIQIIFSKYCDKILKKYFDYKNKKFRKLDYFNEVYIKNIDVCGFISIYMEYLVNNYPTNLKINILNLLIKYTFSDEYADKPINKNKLIEDLTILNKDTNNSPFINKLFNFN